MSARMPIPSALAYACDGGAYQVRGQVSELGVVGHYRARLFDRASGRLIAETWSGADGQYLFTRVAYRYQGYFAIAHDHAAPWHNAAIADMITPEPMP